MSDGSLTNAWWKPIAMTAIALALLGGTALAQSEETAPASAEQQLRQLEAELAEEREAMEAAQQRWSQQEQDLRERRRELAADVLEAHEQADQLEQDHQALQSRRDELTTAVEQLRHQHGEVISTAKAVAEQTLILLEEVPAEQANRERLREALSQLESEDDAEAVAALRAVLATVGQVHERGTTLTIREAEVWNAAGERERVTLLTAGHVAFAYQSADGQRVAIALGSPSEAAGYRWVEQLPADVERSLREAFAAAERGESAAMPMDVSGELRVEAVTEQQAWSDILRSGGMVMFPLAFVAIVALLLILERAFVLYGRNGSAERVVIPMITACRRGDFAEADRLLSRGRGAVARTLAACLQRRGQGTHALEDSIQEQLLHELPKLQRFLGGIAILAAVAPLLGLLGTVTGIIETFGVIRAFGNANPGLMAGGISEALITTATGLTIAIPILLLHAVLRGRVDRIIADAERHAATLLNTLGELGGQANTSDEADDAHGPQPQEVEA